MTEKQGLVACIILLFIAFVFVLTFSAIGSGNFRKALREAKQAHNKTKAEVKALKCRLNCTENLLWDSCDEKQSRLDMLRWSWKCFDSCSRVKK